MKRTFLGILLAIPVLWIIAVFAQNTAFTPIDFELRDPDNRPTYEISGEVQWENIYGTSVRDVHYYPDSIRAALKAAGLDGERWWRIVFDSLRAGTDVRAVLVTVSGKRRRDGPAPFTAHKDTLYAHAERDSLNVDFLPGIDILMEPIEDITVGDTVDIDFFRRSFNKHWASRLTVVPAWSDTLADDGDTTYSLAVRGDLEYMTWFYKGITSSGVDDFGDTWFGNGYQVKFIGGGWSEINVVSDSFHIQQSVVKDTSFVHPIADSIRAAQWGNATTTNLYLEFIEWLGGN